MSTNDESSSEQECESIKSASVTTAEPVMVADDKEEQLNIREVFIKIYHLCHTVLLYKEIGQSTKYIIAITNVLSTMERAYHDIISDKNTNLDEMLALANSYLLLSYKYYDDKKIDLLESCIAKSRLLLEGKELDRKCILIALEVYYFLGFYNEKLNRKASLFAFDKSLQLYLRYTNEEVYPAPYDISLYLQYKISDLKVSSQILSSKDILEERSLLSLRSLLKLYIIFDSQKICDIKYINIDKVVTCQHNMLKNKLNNLSSKNYLIYIEIAELLSNYFIIHNRFTEARDHLAVASFILRKFNENMANVNLDNCTEDEKYKKYIKKVFASAELMRQWVRYGVKLFRLSQERILFDTEDKCNLNSSSLVKSEEKCNELLIFTNIKKDLEEYTAIVQDTYISSYTEANTVFQTFAELVDNVMCHINHKMINPEIMSDIRVAIYMELVLGMSQMHKYFAFYVNKSNKLELYKSRLTKLLTFIKIMYDIDHFDNICSHKINIFFETIIAMNDIFDVTQENYQIIQDNELKVITEHIQKKLWLKIKNIINFSMSVLKLTQLV